LFHLFHVALQVHRGAKFFTCATTTKKRRPEPQPLGCRRSERTQAVKGGTGKGGEVTGHGQAAALRSRGSCSYIGCTVYTPGFLMCP
jgi:hypothetical protein